VSKNSSVIVLSGPIGAGKTELASRLCKRLGYAHIETRRLLSGELAHSVSDPERQQLQNYGADLEAQTHGRWLADRVVRAMAARPGWPGYVIDSARTALQLRGLREVLGSMKHVHLSAAPSVLETRFLARQGQLPGEAPSYSAAVAHPIEGEERELQALADLCVDTSFLSPDEVCNRVITLLEK
jgi:cytidylate kinase